MQDKMQTDIFALVSDNAAVFEAIMGGSHLYCEIVVSVDAIKRLHSKPRPEGILRFLTRHSVYFAFGCAFVIASSM